MKKNKITTKKQVTKKEKINKKIVAKKVINDYLSKRNNKVIIGNWKTNKKFIDIKEFAREYKMLAKNDKVLKRLNFIIGIAPSLVSILPVCGFLGKYVSVVAQHVTPHKSGPYTGQVSYDQVHEYNVNYVLVGHPETRKYLTVSDTFCRDSIRTLLKVGMRPILCIGEDQKQYETGKSKKIVMLQLMNCLKDLTEDEIKQVIIAYEPIWAVSKKVASHEWIINMIKFIRKSIADLYRGKIAKQVHILYGGSITPENAKSILSIEGLDGLIVGASSLKASKFYQIICSTLEYAYVKSILFPQKTKKKK